MTCFLLRKHLRVLPTPTSDTFGILQTLTASQFQRHFGVLPIPSPFQQSPTLPHAPSTPTPRPTPSEGCSETSASSKGNLETSLDSAPSDLNSTLTSFGDFLSHSRDRATPAASDIKGRVIKVIHDIKGRGRSGLVGNAG